MFLIKNLLPTNTLEAYSWDDTRDDTTLSAFSTNAVPGYVWSTLSDIMSISPIVKVFVLPWSMVGCPALMTRNKPNRYQPAWMKSSGSLLGGSLESNDVSIRKKVSRSYVVLSSTSLQWLITCWNLSKLSMSEVLLHTPLGFRYAVYIMI